MVNRESVKTLLEMGYECLKNTDLGAAQGFFEKALNQDFSHPEVLFALKCSRFWTERLAEIETVGSPLLRGDMVVARWKTFKVFLTRIPGDFEMAVYAFKRMCFGIALESYLAADEKSSGELGAEFDFKVGRCRKFLGDYETALEQLARTVGSRSDHARHLAELADCHWLSGDLRKAKLLFREAFFLGPEDIDLDYIESDAISKLAECVTLPSGMSGDPRPWISVYGEITKVFDVKRELRSQESSRINSSILRLENELKENPARLEWIKPRLLSHYFWMLHHYETIQADDGRKERIRGKIRLLDEEIFRQYTS